MPTLFSCALYLSRDIEVQWEYLSRHGKLDCGLNLIVQYSQKFLIPLGFSHSQDVAIAKQILCLNFLWAQSK